MFSQGFEERDFSFFPNETSATVYALVSNILRRETNPF